MKDRLVEVLEMVTGGDFGVDMRVSDRESVVESISAIVNLRLAISRARQINEWRFLKRFLPTRMRS